MLRNTILSAVRCGCSPCKIRRAGFSSFLGLERHYAAAQASSGTKFAKLSITSVNSRSFSSEGKKTVKITFRDKDGDTETVDAVVGDSILDVAFDNDIEIEGACGGEMACSTCHIILDKGTYERLPNAKEEEEDMLDLALGLTKTSRLGCQVKINESMEGITIQLPDETANMQN